MTAANYPLCAGDLMNVEPIVVALDAPIEEAQRLMLEYSVSGLPVIDQAGTLVGVVSQTDFMHLDRPDLRNVVHHRPSGLRVGEVMSHPPLTVLLTTPLAEAARTMLEERVHRVVVIDESHRPIGVISAMDFVQLFADE
jgi:CBS domain-containing protein